MKKLLLPLILLLTALQSQSQVLYLETFDGIPGPTAGGAGTYNFAPGMLLRNVDNLTPAAAVSYVNEAWERREDFSFNVSDSCAFSTSWYSPVGAANDFMWTPAIVLPAFGTVNLTWNAVAYDALFADGYEVRIMTGPQGPPTGGTGVLGNQITNSTQVFNIAAENSSWTARSVNLDSYLGQTIYVGYRNNSNDQFLLLIDDIKVEALNPFDASVTPNITYEYSQVPQSQASITLGADINNLGTSALTNVNLHVEIYNSLNVLVHSDASTAIPSLAPAATAPFTIPSYTPLVADMYTIKYFHTENEVDLNTANDTTTQGQNISNIVYARDTGAITGNLGIGAGNGGYLGQSFTLINGAFLYNITAQFNQGYTGENYASVIWNTNGAGVPTTIFATTDTFQYLDNNPVLTTQPITGGTVFMPAGTYVVTAIEFDSTLSLALTNDIFTTGKMWVNWPTTPFGTWANTELFGAAFAKPYVLRMNIGPTLIPLPSEALFLKGTAGDNKNELSWTNNEEDGLQYNYSLEQSTDVSKWATIYTISSEGTKQLKTYDYTDDQNTSAKKYYRIKVTDRDNKVKYSNTITLLNTGKNTLVELYPNPAKDFITLNTNRFQNASIFIYDAQGKVVIEQKLTTAVTGISLKDLAKGIYQIKVSNVNEILFSDKLVIE